jgi:hypothetical protein
MHRGYEANCLVSPSTAYISNFKVRPELLSVRIESFALSATNPAAISTSKTKEPGSGIGELAPALLLGYRYSCFNAVAVPSLSAGTCSFATRASAMVTEMASTSVNAQQSSTIGIGLSNTTKQSLGGEDDLRRRNYEILTG